MRRFLRIALTVVLVVVIGASSLLVIAWWRTRPEDEPPARRTLRHDVLGCYALFGNEGRRVDTTYYNASPVVELDSASIGRMDDSLRGMWRRVLAFDTLGALSRTTRGRRPHPRSWTT